MLCTAAVFQNCGSPTYSLSSTQASSKGGNDWYEGKIYVEYGAAACSDGTKIKARIVLGPAGTAQITRENCADITPIAIAAQDFSIDPSNPDVLMYAGRTFVAAAPVSLWLRTPLDPLNIHFSGGATGNVGIGTAAPSEKLHVAGNMHLQGKIFLHDDTPLNGKGAIEFRRSDASFQNLLVWSSPTQEFTMGQHATFGNSFHFNSNAGGHFSFLGLGNVGIQTTSPTEKLHVVGNLRVQGTTDCTLGNGAGGTNCSSDIRLKQEVREIPDALDRLLSLRGVEFVWNSKSLTPGRYDIGVIAQDVEKAFPTAVIEDPATGYKKVDYSVLVAPTIQALKELQKSKAAADREIANLKEENAAIKAYLCEKDPRAPVCGR